MTEMNWNTDEHLVAMHQDYIDLGTLERVAYKHGITRQRVSQLLRVGNNKNLFIHLSKKLRSLTIDQEKEFINLIDFGIFTKIEFYRHNTCKSVSWNDFSKYMKTHNITKKSQKGNKEDSINVNENRWVRAYEEIVQNLGFHPSTKIMQHDRKMRSVYLGLMRKYGSFINFRTTYNIEGKNKHKIWNAEESLTIYNDYIASKRNISIIAKKYNYSNNGITRILQVALIKGYIPDYRLHRYQNNMPKTQKRKKIGSSVPNSIPREKYIKNIKDYRNHIESLFQQILKDSKKPITFEEIRTEAIQRNITSTNIAENRIVDSGFKIILNSCVQQKIIYRKKVNGRKYYYAINKSVLEAYVKYETLKESDNIYWNKERLEALSNDIEEFRSKEKTAEKYGITLLRLEFLTQIPRDVTISPPNKITKKKIALS